MPFIAGTAADSKLFPVATRLRGPGGLVAMTTNAGVQGGVMGRSQHSSARALTTFRVVYGAFGRMFDSATVFSPESTQQQTLSAGRNYYRSSIEYPLGTITAVTFNNGEAGVYLNPGQFAVSDPITVAIPKDTVFYSRTYIKAGRLTNVGTFNAGQINSSQTNEGRKLSSPATDEIATVPLSGLTAFVTPPAPLSIVADAHDTGKSVLIVGDSIADGNGEVVQGYAWPEMGFAGATVNVSLETATHSASGVAVMNFGCGNLRADQDTNVNLMQARLAFARRMTHVVIALGTNDLVASRSSAQLQADLLTHITAYAATGARVLIATIPPNTTSSDNWRTTGNQTVLASEAARVAVNTYIRTLPSPAIAVLDLAAQVESSLNSGFWGTFTTTGTASGVPTVTAVPDTSGFRTGDIVYANGLLRTVVSKTATTVVFNANVTAGTGISLIKVLTADGIHPNISGQFKMADLAQPAVLT